MWTIICNFLNFFPLTKNMDYYMQFLEFLYLLQKRGLLYAIYRIYFPSPQMWTIICNFWNLFPFFKNGLSYAIYVFSFSSSKTYTIICNLRNLFPFSKNVDYHMQFTEFL